MAVIREKRNFRVGPIGVARADEGGRIVGEAIAKAANQSADIFFREGLRAAERVGEEAGQAADAGAILTINPQTGQPEAYTPPAPFGTAAAEAYQRVVQRRFEQSMDDEMRTKSAELAARYENNLNGAALYESAMSDYIAAMSENATGQFKGYIADTGASYLNLTRSNLAINQMRRERAAAARAQAEAAEASNDSLQQLVSRFGPAFIETSFYENLVESGNVVVDDGTASGLLDPDASTAHARDRNLSVASGLIEHAARNVENSRDAFIIREAIQLRDPSLILQETQGYEHIAQMIVDSRSDPDLQDSIASVAQSLLTNSIDVLQTFEQEAELRRQQDLLNDELNIQFELGMYNEIAERTRLQREADEKAAEEQRAIDQRLAAHEMSENASISASRAQLQASNPNNNSISISRDAVQIYQQAGEEIKRLIAAGDNVEPELLEATREARDTVIAGYINGLHSLLVRDENGNILTGEELLQVETAIDELNFSEAPNNQVRQALYGLRNIASSLGLGVYDFQDGAKSFISGIGDGSALRSEQLLTETANDRVENELIPLIDEIIFARGGEDIANRTLEALSRLDEIDHPDRGIATSLRRDIHYNRAQAIVSSVLPSLRSPEALEDADTILREGGSSELLGEEISSALQTAGSLARENGRRSDLQTFFNGRRQTILSELQAEAQAAERTRNDIRIFALNQGDTSSENDRVRVTAVLDRAFQLTLSQNGYGSLDQMVSDPAAWSNPAFRPLIDEMRLNSTMPQSVYTLLSSVADGNVTGANLQAAMTAWGNLREYRSDDFRTIRHPMMGALTDQQQVVLDYLTESARILGTENVGQIIESFDLLQRSQSDETFQSQIETFFEGDTPEQFIRNLDGGDLLNSSQIRSMTGAALALSTLGRGRYNLGQVRTRLQNHLDLVIPDGEGYVIGANGERRVRESLSFMAQGDEQEFRNYVGLRAADAIGGAIVFGVDNYASPNATRVFLQPFGLNTPAFSQTVLMIDRPIEDGGPYAAMETYLETDDEGNTIEVTGPVIITNTDPVLARRIASKRARLAAQQIEDARSLVVRQAGDPENEFDPGPMP